MSHSVTFRPSGRGKAQCAPDPEYPNGIELDLRGEAGLPSCLVPLKYPAPECGVWMVDCSSCSILIAVTAAGRPDDPRSVQIPCKARLT
jgi:hypothetical protein